MIENQLEGPSNEPIKSDIQPEEMISFISLPHYELHKLIGDPQAFVNKVGNLNNQAKTKIERKAYKEALLLLNEAEKILQYAAGSGKNIDRDLIISVLHNLSCTYQHLWILPKCATYIEGLIFNLDNHILSLQSSISSAQINQNSYEKTSTYEVRKSLSIYYLKFLALNSQLKQHKSALNAGRKALTTLRDILMENQVYIKRTMKEEGEALISSNKTIADKKQYLNWANLKYTLMAELLNFSDNVDIKSYKNLIKAAHFSYQIYTKERFAGNEHPYAAHFKKFSIGNLMQIQPLKFIFKQTEKESWKEKPTSNQIAQPQQSLIFKFILLSISFFSIGTEIRMILNEERPTESTMSKQSDERYRESDIYHLLAIITLTVLVPFEILFLKHLLNSYKTHYHSDFFDYKTVDHESIAKIISLISGKKLEKDEIYIENEYHLKERILDKGKTQKNIPTVRKIKNKTHRSKEKKSSFKTISFLENKSTVIEKDYPHIESKTSSREKTVSKSKSKFKKKSKSRIATQEPYQIYQKQYEKNMRTRQKGKSSKSKSKGKKSTKSGSHYSEKYKSGSHTSSNKQTYFASKEIGLSSILENRATRSKLQREKEKDQIHVHLKTHSNSKNRGFASKKGSMGYLKEIKRIKNGKSLKDLVKQQKDKIATDKSKRDSRSKSWGKRQ